MTKDTKLVTFTPAVEFDGYPFDRKVTFKPGEESIPVPEDFATMVRDKGYIVPRTRLHEPKEEPSE